MTNSAVKEASSDYQLSTVNSQFANEVKQVPVGYKQTEVGVIPEDWEVYSLGNIGKFKNGINKSADDFGFGSPFVNLMDVFGKPEIMGDEEFDLINSSELDKKEYSLLKGDVLFIRSSVKPSGVGLTTVVKFDLKSTVYSGFLIRFRCSDWLTDEFKKYCFYEQGFRNRVVSGSTVSANTNINQETLKEIYIAFPSSRNEQTAIAKALSDVDALIQKLEKLIAKKQAIKTATMQQLLTGRTRLPPFALREDGSKKGTKPSELGEIPEDWEVFPLLDIATLIHGKAHEPYVVDAGKYVVVNSKFVSTEGKVRKYCSQNDCAARKGDVLMVLSDLPNGKALAKCFYADKDDVYAVNQRVCIFRSNVFDSKYLQLILNRHKYFLALDDGVTQTHILNGDIANCQLYAPENREEQTAIATILSDMDAEIQALEQRLSKTRQIKQGMMQELLTGKTRLIQGKLNG
ncbi:MAG: restriction endonuclease subunit S [Gammaproteobacteria bacterium]|nr:restriction endonuclease subunit S [Gammaproteobacteria bacterium]